MDVAKLHIELLKVHNAFTENLDIDLIKKIESDRGLFTEQVRAKIYAICDILKKINAIDYFSEGKDTTSIDKNLFILNKQFEPTIQNTFLSINLCYPNIISFDGKIFFCKKPYDVASFDWDIIAKEILNSVHANLYCRKEYADLLISKRLRENKG